MTQPASTKICIMYGFCEGRALGRRLRRELRAAGLSITNKPEDADIILAHSAACFEIPATRPEQKIVMVGIPYWPGKKALHSFLEHISTDSKAHRAKHPKYWHYKIMWNFIYLWRPSNIRKVKARANQSLWQLRDVVVIRNKKDSFCAPGKLPFENDYVAISMPGHHDHLWFEPAPYISVIQSEYGQ